MNNTGIPIKITKPEVLRSYMDVKGVFASHKFLYMDGKIIDTPYEVLKKHLAKFQFLIFPSLIRGYPAMAATYGNRRIVAFSYVSWKPDEFQDAMYAVVLGEDGKAEFVAHKEYSGGVQETKELISDFRAVARLIRSEEKFKYLAGELMSKNLVKYLKTP